MMLELSNFDLPIKFDNPYKTNRGRACIEFRRVLLQEHGCSEVTNWVLKRLTSEEVNKPQDGYLFTFTDDNHIVTATDIIEGEYDAFKYCRHEHKISKLFDVQDIDKNFDKPLTTMQSIETVIQDVISLMVTSGVLEKVRERESERLEVFGDSVVEIPGYIELDCGISCAMTIEISIR